MTAFSAVLLVLAPARADIVTTRDGGRLPGHIIEISDGVIKLKTAYAGELKIDQKEVTGITVDESVFARLNDGSTIGGTIKQTDNNQLQISHAGGVITTAADKVTQLWRADAEDPRLVKVRMEEKAKQNNWKYEAGVDINGKRGNTKQSNIDVALKATMEGPHDKLIIYGSVDLASQDGVKTARDIKGGIDFSSYLSKRFGWYARTELESDRFKDLTLRAAAAGGLNFFFWRLENHMLEGRVGLGYRYDNYTTGKTENLPGLDFMLKHYYKFSSWGTIKTDLGYSPAFGDFGNYLFTQDTGLEMPLGMSKFWTLRIGFANYYNSQPPAGKKSLDTTYYTRLILSWL